MSSALVTEVLTLTRSERLKPASSRMRLTLSQAFSAWVAKSGGRVPSGAKPGVPAVTSQRTLGATSSASLYKPQCSDTPMSWGVRCMPSFRSATAFQDYLVPNLARWAGARRTGPGPSAQRSADRLHLAAGPGPLCLALGEGHHQREPPRAW